MMFIFVKARGSAVILLLRFAAKGLFSLAVISGCFLHSALGEENGWSVRIPATGFDRAQFRDPLSKERIQSVGNLSGRPDPRKNPNEKGRGRVIGWVEYDFTTPKSAWYEISIDGPAVENQYLINGTVSLTPAEGGKVGSVWLEDGSHTLRMERTKWEGFSPITEVVVRETKGEALGNTVRYDLIGASTVFAKGGDMPLQIHAGARTTPSVLEVRLVNVTTGEAQSEHRIPVESARKPLDFRVDIPLREAGIFDVLFFENGLAIDPTQLAPLRVVVVDTTPVKPALAEAPRRLIEEIDCVTREPDFSNGEPSRVVETVAGKYRESGDVGYLQNMNAENPSWFSYKVTLPDLDGPYIVEVDYPDDTVRTMIVQIRQGVPELGLVDRFPYTMGVGSDTGREFSLSNQMQTLSLLVWPNGRDWRITLITPHNGSRAGASKIRIYRVDGPLRPIPGLEPNGRPYVQWYEEGFSYLTAFGGGQNSIPDIVRGTDRWLKSTAYMGANVVIPTVAIYQMAMYPSLYNRDFNQPTTFDAVRLILLLSEKYGLDFIAEFAPEAREVGWLTGVAPAEAGNILRNKNGLTPEAPLRGYNPAHPLNQEWYLAMLREFVERYSDSPRFKGVCLRVMEWSNPGLINFHSIDWGYDDFTIALFENESGISIPVSSDNPRRFAQRFDWLMANKKAEWIAWRCAKVTEIYRKVVEMVRSIRPDLVVYTDIFPRPWRLEPMGVNIGELSKIEGLEILHGLHKYGRRYDAVKSQDSRDMFVDPENLLVFAKSGAEPNFLFNQAYLEATKVVTPNHQLGYPPHAPHGWMSGVANPAGPQINERLAIALAEADAQMLGDGGNAYTLGQPETRLFLQQFRQLPRVRFNPREDARDPVAVWEAMVGENFWFYAVNREAFELPVKVSFGEVDGLVRAVDSSPEKVDHGSLTFLLQPYELRVWRAGRETRIDRVEVSIPAERTERVKAQVAWMADLQRRIETGDVAASDTQREAVERAVKRSVEALDKGYIRTARSLLENAVLIEFFEQISQYPPGLRDMGLAAKEKAK